MATQQQVILYPTSYTYTHIHKRPLSPAHTTTFCGVNLLAFCAYMLETVH